jgi:hypothetical protein
MEQIKFRELSQLNSAQREKCTSAMRFHRQSKLGSYLVFRLFEDTVA